MGTGAELATVRMHARTRAAVPRGSIAYMAAAASPAADKAMTSVLCGWGGGIFRPRPGASGSFERRSDRQTMHKVRQTDLLFAKKSKCIQSKVLSKVLARLGRRRKSELKSIGSRCEDERADWPCS